MSDLFNEEIISQATHTKWAGKTVHFAREIDSTNLWGKRVWKEEGAKHGELFVAEYQSAGRGRFTRRWSAPPDSAITMSILICPEFSPMKAPMLTLVMGLSVAQAVADLGLDVGIKWPNDVLLGEKKVCGILCESKIQGGKVSAVCGMGINLCQDEDFFIQNNLPHATSLLAFDGQRRTAQEAAVLLLEELEPILEQYRQEGFSPFAASYCDRCVTLGRQVRVIRGQQEVTAQAISIAPDGGLICQKAGENFVIRSGEASVRGLYGYA